MTPAAALPQSYLYFPEFKKITHSRLSGLGTTAPTSQASLANQITQFTGTAAVGTVSALALAGVITTATAGLVIPIIGAGIAAATVAISLILNSGCGQTCIVTSNWANQAEQLLEQNLASYFALPAPRAQTAKAVALANFDNVWNYLKQQCGNPQLGTAGQHCISDRQAGSCIWKQTSNSTLLQYPGEPQPGQCWNWFSGYRDPIANDTNVAPDSIATPAPITGTSGGGTSIGGLDVSNLLLVGGIGMLLWGVFS